jgi:hypothetical protein
MSENMLLDCIFLHIMLERAPNKKKCIYLNSMTSSKSTKVSENIEMADVISSVKISKNSTWIPLDNTHIN